MSKCRSSNSRCTASQLGDDFLLRQGKRTADDGGDAMDVGGNEGAEDDARALGQQRHLMAAEADGTHEVGWPGDDGTRRVGDQVFGVVHFGEGEVEGEGGLRALVFVHPVGVQAVAAAAGGEIVERQAEIIAAQEPFEGAFRLD